MSLDQHFNDRAARDREFQAEREALQREYAFHRALPHICLDAGLTWQALADRIGMKQSAIARLESGMAQPSFDLLRRLSCALNVNFEIMPRRRFSSTIRTTFPPDASRETTALGHPIVPIDVTCGVAA